MLTGSIVCPCGVALTPSATTCKASHSMMAGGEAGEGWSRVLDKAFREAKPSLRNLAIRLCRNRSDADDLVQDTFLRALRFGGEAALQNPRAWLATILHNIFVDRCRAKARRPSHEPLTDRIATESEPFDDKCPAWSRATMTDLHAAVEELEPGQRRVYQMHVFEGLSYDTIAEILRINRVTVGTRLTRARHHLRDILSKLLGEEEEP
jgi:RNA polymerase sigma-70 factor, ECF subfamily